MYYTKPLAKLVEYFCKFPGVGPKSAQRMAFHVLKLPFDDVKGFSDAVMEAKNTINCCNECFNMSSQNPCEICSSTGRNRSKICVVAETKDLIAVEKTNEYRGLYHVLQGTISPLDGIGPDDLRIKELLGRISQNEIEEIILALNPSVEGEATALYLTRILKPFDIKLTRIASGLPVGGDLEYVDELTLAKALEGRVSLF